MRLSEVFAFRLDRPTADLLLAVAAREGRAPAAVIRRAVVADLPRRIEPENESEPPEGGSRATHVPVTAQTTKEQVHEA